ncbi:MAG: 50S ribosomal protein L4 [Nanoarchaeota archaeon]|nr:50S ribosomal protein L4 [Nanoarchaeota archaeon]
MNVPVYSVAGAQKGTIQLTPKLTCHVRVDVIRRAVLAERSQLRQPYGADPKAGQRTSAHYHGRRGIRYSMMNRETARLPRIHGRVGHMAMTARFVPQATKGRKAHPPVPRSFKEKINKKERRFALCAAFSASTKKEIVLKRGHKADAVKSFPLILEDGFAALKTVKETKKLLVLLGLQDELARVAVTKTRAGKGKIRGRRKITRKGPIVVVHEDKGIGRGVANLAGFDIVNVHEIRVEDLAPGGDAGRMAIFTESAIKELERIAH